MNISEKTYQNVINVLTSAEYVELLFNLTNRHLKLNDKSITNTLIQITQVCKLDEDVEVMMALTPVID